MARFRRSFGLSLPPPHVCVCVCVCVCVSQRKGEGCDDVGARHARGSGDGVGVRRVPGVKVRRVVLYDTSLIGFVFGSLSRVLSLRDGLNRRWLLVHSLFNYSYAAHDGSGEG